MDSVDIAYAQPWFDPIFLLQDRERRAFSSYFDRLEWVVSRLMKDEPDIYETSLTTTLVNAIRGTDSAAKAELEQQLKESAIRIGVTARELRGRPAASGELLDFAIEVKFSAPGIVWLHKVLLAEGKRLYPDGQAFTWDSRFKELNRPETKKAGTRSVRSAVQTKTMMEVHCRAGVFFLYCPRTVNRRHVGIRVLFPETACMLPYQPTLRHVSEDTLPFAQFMLEHLFTGRRGVDAAEAASILRDDSERVSVRYHLILDVILPEARKPDLGRRSRH